VVMDVDNGKLKSGVQMWRTCRRRRARKNDVKTHLCSS
jgi:hypothetical protein